VLRAQASRDLFGERYFVLRGSLIFGEAQRHGAQRAAAARRKRCDTGRVEPRRQEDRNRHVSDEMRLDALGNRLADARAR
jgi:hypothetical protein